MVRKVACQMFLTNVTVLGECYHRGWKVSHARVHGAVCVLRVEGEDRPRGPVGSEALRGH